jgi:hypothetical protein
MAPIAMDCMGLVYRDCISKNPSRRFYGNFSLHIEKLMTAEQDQAGATEDREFLGCRNLVSDGVA